MVVSTSTDGIYDQIYIGWLVVPDFFEALDLQWKGAAINILKSPYDTTLGWTREDKTKLSFSETKFDSDGLLIMNPGF